MLKSSLILLAIMLLLGCDLSSSKELKTTKLESIFYDIESHYSMGEYTSIMTFYDKGFLHNSNSYLNAENFWFDSVLQYQFIEFSNLAFEISDNYATPIYKIKFIDEDTSVTIDSKDFEWLPKLKKISGEWKFYGNQNEK